MYLKVNMEEIFKNRYKHLARFLPESIYQEFARSELKLVYCLLSKIYISKNNQPID